MHVRRAGLFRCVDARARGTATLAALIACASATASQNGEWPKPPASVAQATESTPTDEDFLAARPGDWLTYNRSFSADRYSPLDEINIRNAHRLQVACVFQPGHIGSFETSPVVFGGRMYVTTAYKTFALDAATCRPLWSHTYTPSGPEHMIGNRGVALYDGKVFRGTSDAHLLALDAASGKLLWDVHVNDSSYGYLISGAPVAFDGKVFTGEAGADFGITGHVYAFDADTGRHIWTFDIVPTGDQPGAETWGGGQAQGGGSTWSSMAIDPERRLLLVPTGNPGPSFNADLRPGDNLFTNSIVALDLDTGRLDWYVQQVPHDVRDWDTAATPTLYTIDGWRRVAVASKDGYLYIYDADTRETVAKTEIMRHENHDVPLSYDRPIRVCPGALGLFNGASHSPLTRMLFVGTAERCETIQQDVPHYIKGKTYFGARVQGDPPEQQFGWLRGIDAATGEQRWVLRMDRPMLAGTTPTAGGVLFTGTLDGEFLAIEQTSGRILYRFQTGGAIAGGVSTYAVDGKQYVAVASGNSSRGWGTSGSATIVVFTLP